MVNITDIDSLKAILGVLSLTPTIFKPIPGFLPLFSKLDSAVSPILNPLNPLLQPLTAAIPAPVSNAFSSLVGTLEPMVNGLRPLAAVLNPVPEALGPALNALDPILAMTSPILSTVTNPLTPVTGALLGPLEQSTEILKGLGLSLPALFNADASDASPDSIPLTSPTELMKQSSSACVVPDYNVTDRQPDTFRPFDRSNATIYRYRQQQSVNLGSWFVLEQWMVPSLFQCASGKQVSELDVVSGWGSVEGARQILERHWDTFITEQDFRYLASVGINTVRLPIGYWTLGPAFCSGTPFEPYLSAYQGSWWRVVRAIGWAEKYGIGVLIDLHGAPGSQNGQPHSGISDGQINLFGNSSYMQKTIDVLKFLAVQLTPVSNCVGIELLNEPQDAPQLADFYNEAIETLRAVSPKAQSFPFYIHDAFDLQRFSNFTAGRNDFVVQDHHSYFIYTPADDQESASQHTTDVETGVSKSLMQAANNERRNLVIDEWSCALTPNSLGQEEDPDTARSTFCRSQMSVYAKATSGWSFWSYKKESCTTDPGWCFISAVGETLPATFFSYSGQRSTYFNGSNLNMDSDTTLPPYAMFADMTSRSNAAPCTGCPGRQRRQQPKLYDASLIVSASDVAEHKASSKGYSDGFLTAEIFAQHGMSRLGFIDQYISDSLLALGPTLGAGWEQSYHDWFVRGLADGEASVRAGTMVE